LLVRRALKPVKKALAEAIKPEFQSLPKTAHSTSREFGKRRPNYQGNRRRRNAQMGELLEKETSPEPVFSQVVRGRNAGCLHAVGAAKSDLERGTREEPNYKGKGRPFGVGKNAR